MITRSLAYRLFPWAWFVAWMLTGAGAVLSDIYSTPTKSLVPFFALSAIGWIAASYITVRASPGGSSMTIQLAAWTVTYLIVIPLGLLWMSEKHTGTVLVFDPFLLAAAIGAFASSARRGVWRFLSPAMVGILFLLFSPFVTFYTGLLLLAAYSSTINLYGSPLSSSYALFWALPNSIFGLIIGFAMRWILGFKKDDPSSSPQ